MPRRGGNREFWNVGQSVVSGGLKSNSSEYLGAFSEPSEVLVRIRGAHNQVRTQKGSISRTLIEEKEQE